MKLEAAREAYYTHSGKLSDVTRQLNYAGIGVIWVLRVGKDTGGIKFDSSLMACLFLFSLGLFADLMHYAFASALWGRFAYLREKDGFTNEQDCGHAPEWINWPALLLFWGKVVLCIAGQTILVSFLYSKL